MLTGTLSLDLQVEVDNVEELKKLITTINRLQGVTDVEEVDNYLKDDQE